MKRVFVSYSHADNYFAERLARDLRDAGLDVWIDFRSIPGGADWEQAIFEGIAHSEFAVVCLSPDSVGSEWVRREILMARSRHLQVIPVLAANRADTMTLMKQHAETEKLLDIQMIDFERFGYERAFPMLLDALPKLTPPPLAGEAGRGLPLAGEAGRGLPLAGEVGRGPDIDPAAIPNPFKGLEAFQQTDAHLFFGREALTQKLLDRLSDSRADRFLAIVGASGSGKSSLARAGLIPKIRAGALPDSTDWPLVILTPGAFPTQSLSLRLMPVVTNRGLPASAVEVLEKGAPGLHILTESLLAEAPRSARLVLVVDQFEEVFTRATPDNARQFLDLLITAVTQPDGQTLVVLTMRADFFDRLSAYPPLATLFEQDNLVIATDMQPDELRRGIEGPAQAVGLSYDHGLVETILEDVRQQPGSLPLLQYALKELYTRREGRWLKTAAYQSIGGVRGALANHAQTIYDRLATPRHDPSPPLHATAKRPDGMERGPGGEEQALMRRLFLRLIEVSETGEATRRRVSRDALTFQDVPPEAVDHLIALLTAPENRLLVASRPITSPLPQGEGPGVRAVLELSHEALVREWPLLRDWIAQDAANLHYGSDLLMQAQAWQQNGRATDYLLMGARVTRAQFWLENADANDLQREFIAASADHADQLARLKEQEQAEKLRLAQAAAESQRQAAEQSRRAETAERARATRARRAALFASLVGVLAIIGTVGFAIVATNTAQQINNTRLEIDRFSTLNAGEVAVPLLTQTPDIFIPTLTGIAALNAFTPTVEPHEANGFSVPMVYVPAGCFFMGIDRGFGDERPAHEQCFDQNQTFWIDQFEVTNEQYARFIEADGYQTRQWWTEAGWQFLQTDTETRPVQYDGFTDPPQPRVGVTWYEADAYCRWRGARLPTEREWEYAARGPDSRVYPWGNQFPQDDPQTESDESLDYLAYFANSDATRSVGADQRAAGQSWVGAYDLSGNVWEWVSTIYDSAAFPYPYQADDGREDPERTGVLRVLRGGAWLSLDTYVRAAVRGRDSPDNWYSVVGFRCVRLYS